LGVPIFSFENFSLFVALMQQFLNSIALKGSGIIRYSPSDIVVNYDIW